MPYVPDGAGELLVGVGVAREYDASFPLSGLSGDLTRFPALDLSYSFAPGAVFVVRGDLRRWLAVERRDAPSVPLEPGALDGVTSDVGDFEVGTLFRLVGGADGFSGGLHLEVKLPNSGEEAGIGPNSTDVAGSLFGSWGGAALRANAALGVAILEAPLESFTQNDVLVYAAEVVWRRPGLPLRLEVGAAGRASTRDRVPLGTEDRGRIRARATWLEGRWRLDGGLAVGYAEAGPGWGVELGVARVFEL